MDQLIQLFSTHLSEIIAYLAGLGSGVAIKVAVDRSKRVSITQRDNFVSGNMAGRDNVNVGRDMAGRDNKKNR